MKDKEQALAAIAVRTTLAACALLLLEAAFIAVRSGSHKLLLSIAAVPLLTITTGPLLVVRFAVFAIPVALTVDYLLSKRSQLNWLVATPWTSTIISSIWASYWLITRQSQSFSNFPKLDGWSECVIPFTLILSASSWTAMLCMRRHLRLQIAVIAVSQLVLQLNVIRLAHAVFCNQMLL